MVRKKGTDGQDGDRGRLDSKGQGLGVRSQSKERGRIPRAPSPAMGGECEKMIGLGSEARSYPISGALVFPKSVTITPPVLRPNGMPELEDVEDDVLMHTREHVNEKPTQSWADRVDNESVTATPKRREHLGVKFYQATPHILINRLCLPREREEKQHTTLQ